MSDSTTPSPFSTSDQDNSVVARHVAWLGLLLVLLILWIVRLLYTLWPSGEWVASWYEGPNRLAATAAVVEMGGKRLDDALDLVTRLNDPTGKGLTAEQISQINSALSYASELITSNQQLHLVATENGPTFWEPLGTIIPTSVQLGELRQRLILAKTILVARQMRIQNPAAPLQNISIVAAAPQATKTNPSANTDQQPDSTLKGKPSDPMPEKEGTFHRLFSCQPHDRPTPWDLLLNRLPLLTPAREASRPLPSEVQLYNKTYAESRKTTRPFVMGSDEINYPIIVFLFGVLGATIRTLSSLGVFAGNRNFKSQWIPYYLFQPIIGGGLAIAFYALLRGGFMNTDASADMITNIYAFCALGLLVGMSIHEALQKIKNIAQELFTKTEPKKDTLDKSTPSTNTSSTSRSS